MFNQGILAWRWATKGVTDPYDRAVMAVLVAMNSVAGFAFLRRGYYRPPPVALLLGTSTMIVGSQVL